MPLLAAGQYVGAQSPPLEPVTEYHALNMTLNALETGAQRMLVMDESDVFNAMTAAPDPIRVTSDAMDERSIGRYPVFVQTVAPELTQSFMEDRFPGRTAIADPHLQYPSYIQTTFYAGYGDNSESQQDDPWRRGNVNKPAAMSYSRFIDIITGQARVKDGSE